MKPKRRTRDRRRAASTVPSGTVGETLTLAGLSLLVRGAVMTVSDERGANGSRSSFDVQGARLSGELEASTGTVRGLRLLLAGDMVSLAWGDDEWFDRTFMSMVPPPSVTDLREPSRQVDSARLAAAVGWGDLKEGQVEAVLRTDLSGMVEAIETSPCRRNK